MTRSKSHSETVSKIFQIIVFVVTLLVPVIGRMAGNPGASAFFGWFSFLAKEVPGWTLAIPVLVYMIAMFALERFRDQWETPVMPSDLAKETISLQDTHIKAEKAYRECIASFAAEAKIQSTLKIQDLGNEVESWKESFAALAIMQASSERHLNILTKKVELIQSVLNSTIPKLHSTSVNDLKTLEVVVLTLISALIELGLPHNELIEWMKAGRSDQTKPDSVLPRLAFTMGELTVRLCRSSSALAAMRQLNRECLAMITWEDENLLTLDSFSSHIMNSHSLNDMMQSVFMEVELFNPK